MQLHTYPGARSTVPGPVSGVVKDSSVDGAWWLLAVQAIHAGLAGQACSGVSWLQVFLKQAVLILECKCPARRQDWVALPEWLEQSGLEHRSLIKNEDFDERNDVAPWLVRLKGGNRFTRILFTKSDATQHLWGTKRGIFIRSGTSLDELHRQFRAFIRVQDEQRRGHFLAHWSHPLGNHRNLT